MGIKYAARKKLPVLGPFHLKQVVAGERIVLERNPYYWKMDGKGQKLPSSMSLPSPGLCPDRMQSASAFQAESNSAQIVSGMSGRGNDISPHWIPRTRRRTTSGLSCWSWPGMANYLMFNLNDDTAGKLPIITNRNGSMIFVSARLRNVRGEILQASVWLCVLLATCSPGFGHHFRSYRLPDSFGRCSPSPFTAQRDTAICRFPKNKTDLWLMLRAATV